MPHLARILTDPEEKLRAKFIVKARSRCSEVGQGDFQSPIRGPGDSHQRTQYGYPSHLFTCGLWLRSQPVPADIHSGGDAVSWAASHRRAARGTTSPTAQLEMGGFFAELWNDRKVPSLIETHSANIILRLRKLVSKGQLESRRRIGSILHFGKIAGKRVAHTRPLW